MATDSEISKRSSSTARSSTTLLESHTRRLIARSAGIMASQGVDVEILHVLEHDIAFGMVKDATKESGLARDDWPGIQAKIMDADILVVGTPIWLGMKSSVSMLVIERMYAYSGDRNDKGQYLYYGKTAGLHRHRQRGRHKGVREGNPLCDGAHRLYDPSAAGLRLDRRSGPGRKLR